MTSAREPGYVRKTRDKIMSILRGAVGPIDATTRADLRRMEIAQLTTCARVVLLAQDRYIQEMSPKLGLVGNRRQASPRNPRRESGRQKGGRG